jgi:hypothetical protein
MFVLLGEIGAATVFEPMSVATIRLPIWAAYDFASVFGEPGFAAAFFGGSRLSILSMTCREGKGESRNRG